jgi:hypothetical protein
LVKVQPAGDANAESLARSSSEPALTRISRERSARAKSRWTNQQSNKDGKIVPGATKAFKTAACLNVTLAHAKLVAQFWWLAIAPIVVVV